MRCLGEDESFLRHKVDAISARGRVSELQLKLESSETQRKRARIEHDRDIEKSRKDRQVVLSCVHTATRVTAFSGISGNLLVSVNSAKVRKKAQSSGKVGERSGNLYSRGNLIVAAQQICSPVLYLYWKSFFIRDVHG